MKKIGIDMISQNVSNRPNSHGASWAYMWAAQMRNSETVVDILRDNDWNDYDEIYIYHNCFTKKFTPNFFSGINNDVLKKFNQMIELGADRVFSLDIDMFDYGKYVKEKRLSNPSTCDEAKLMDWDKLSDICQNIKTIKQSDLNSNHLIIGDSHSVSMYVKGACVNRTDGKTLNGALNAGLKTFISPYKHNISKLTFYFGNIDIRHHLCRLNDGNYVKNIDDIIQRYEKQLIELHSENYKIELISALPIENESRIIPYAAGMYNGKPFYGTWHERNNCRIYFNRLLEDMCKRNGFEYYSHPNEYLNNLGELSFSVMEPTKNVHLGRQFYRWNFESDKRRVFNDDW